METLLLHKSHIETETFNDICSLLKSEGVTIYSGPNLKKLLTFGPPLAKSLKTEYSSLECTIEAVSSLEDAVNHINAYGSGHTDSIVTENSKFHPETYFVMIIAIYNSGCSQKVFK